MQSAAQHTVNTTLITDHRSLTLCPQSAVRSWCLLPPVLCLALPTAYCFLRSLFFQFRIPQSFGCLLPSAEFLLAPNPTGCYLSY